MRDILNNKIGNGGHWDVVRVIADESTQQSVIYKLPIRGSVDLINKNIDNYSLIYNCGLPTLSYYKRKTYNGAPAIEAEDLNPADADGLFVSPNTMRGYPKGRDIIIGMLNGEMPTNEQYSKIEAIISKGNLTNLTDTQMTQLDELIFAVGAEAILYENKITTVSNITLFLETVKQDILKASKNNIGLFSDAFFFKVNESNNNIEYKIADFDCITNHSSTVGCDVLNNGNWSYFTTALKEFIHFFVVKEKQTEYLAIIK